MNISLFELEPQEKAFFKKHLKNHNLHFEDKPLSLRTAKKHSDAQVVVIFILSKIDDAVLKRMPRLEFITTMSTGYDHIDLAAAKKQGIRISRVPVYGQNTVAEHAFALLQTLNRHIIEAVARTRTGNFDYTGLLGHDLSSQTLGIIGTGHIGEYMIRYAKAFNMKVLAYDKNKRKDLANELGFRYVSLRTLCKQSDIISLHVPLLTQTHHLIGKKEFSIMKKGVLLINTGRGPLIDTKELIKALDKGVVAGAALDVLELESDLKQETKLAVSLNSDKRRLATIIENHDLIFRPNVIITPHLAFYTHEALHRILMTTLQNIRGHQKKRYRNTV